ncbi:MAG: leucyl/phenylalanyl-tRNA--protein transferase [Bacteroidales bacterium]|nr:leucyl/phenylalanyl-tRNA--protein transferase [Bacteroidales bacterium]
MPVFRLNEEPVFPDPRLAEEDGLLAVGGDYSIERLICAYQHGIFPWFKYEEDIYWFATNPRMVVYPEQYKPPHGLKRSLKKRLYSVTMNKDFEAVIDLCAKVPRKEEGSWINDDYRNSLIKLHELGIAHSFESWYDGKLAGGLYGIQVGKGFTGESMFHLMDDASKYAFHFLMEYAKSENWLFVDAQQDTPHLRSLGGVNIEFQEFYKLLERAFEE